MARCIGVLLNGQAGPTIGSHGSPIEDDLLLIILNAHHDVVEFTLPAVPVDGPWTRLIDTAEPSAAQETLAMGSVLPIKGRSACRAVPARHGAGRSMTGFAHDLPFGAQVQPDGRVRFRLWAPGQDRVSLLIEQQEAVPLQRGDDGWFELTTDQARGRQPLRLPAVQRPARSRPRVPAAGGQRSRPQRGGRSAGVPVAQRRLARAAVERGRALRASCRHFQRQRRLRRRAAQARLAGGARRHRDRADAGRGLRGLAELGL